MEKLILRMSHATAKTALRGLRPGTRFDVVYNDALADHAVQFLTEAEWVAGAQVAGDQRPAYSAFGEPVPLSRYINLNGEPLLAADLDAMHAALRDSADGRQSRPL